jgi:hypothetical protein
VNKTPHVLSFQSTGIARHVRDRSAECARAEACRAAAAVGDTVALVAEDYTVIGRTYWDGTQQKYIFREDTK